MTSKGLEGFRWAGPIAAMVVLAGATAAAAQTLSTPSLVNNSDPNELVLGSSSVPSRERETSLARVSAAAGSFVTRFAALVTADGDGGPGGAGGEFLAADYEVSFTATAPGAYRLTVATALRGDLHLVNDSVNGASADVGPVSGLLTGGTIIGGGLDLPDAGSVTGSAGATSGIDERSSATVFGVSNGAPVAHALRFQWTNFASTSATPGDEAAVRLGATSDVPTETAGDYQDSLDRVQADDGHFVTVTIESLCGNGVLDAGPSYAEDCDEGSGNGSPASCCAASCSFNPDDSSCDDDDACTLGDVCKAGVCTSNGLEACPLCQTCDSMGGCVVGPRKACKLGATPLQSRLQLSDKALDTGDQVVFKWNKGEATENDDFGNPVSDVAPVTDYALCMFDEDGVPLLQARAPGAGLCGTRPCWKALGIKGFSYRDPDRTPDGADTVLLKAGLPGKGRAQFRGKGENLPPLPLPLPLPVTVQLQSTTGQCWAATFSEGSKPMNDALRFKGKGD